jgi:hypothetical protein
MADLKFKDMRIEADVKENVKRVLDSVGPLCWWFMPAANGYGRAGIPDFIGGVNGHLFAVETKFGKGELTALQIMETNKVHVSGGRVWIVRETNFDTWHIEFTAWAALCS